MKKTTHTIKAFTFILMTVLMSVSASVWALDEVTPSVTLTTYYSSADGKKSDALRTALQDIIDNHTNIGYDNLKYLMKYSDTEEANGTDVVDIYSNCTFTSGATNLTWASSGSVGDGMNREHTVPQSWFGEAVPMVGDAFHIYPTDCKANNNRSSYLYGEFSGAGTSYSSSSCSESGKLSTGSSNSIASYTYGGKTYSPTATHSGKVYEPADEYKGDIARGYFYMATRYANVCSSWSGGAFGSDNNGFKNYTAELMLKWHRLDPVSRKELIRNEVIYGNTKYNKGTRKQGNRNPFIDYPELVEYIWGDKKDQNVSISGLTSAYTTAGSGSSGSSSYEVRLSRNGVVEIINATGTYTLPTASTEAEACSGWSFAGWTTNSSVNSTSSAPSFTTSVSSASTLYAVYSNTVSFAPIRRAAAKDAVLWAEDFSGYSSNDVPSGSTANSHTGTTVYGGGSVSYSCVSGSSGTTKVYAEALAGGTSPELLISKNSGSFSIAGIPTGDASAMTLTFKTNKTSGLAVTSGTTGISIGTLSISSGTATCDITNSSATTFDLTITYSPNNNSREDNFSLTVKTAGSGSGGGSGSETTTYNTSPTCGDSHTITLSSGGVVTGGEFEANTSSAYAGAVITLAAEPSDGYTFGSWTVTNNSTSETIPVNDDKFTMPDANVTVSASFSKLATYNIRFYNNGAQIGSTQSVYVGGEPVVPDDPEGCDGYTFVGWWTAELEETNTTSQTWVTNFTVSKAQDYYAIFSKTETSGGGGGTGGTVTILPTSTGVPSSYAAEAECTIGSYKYGIKQMYLNNSTMQWRASTNSAGAGYLYNKSTYPSKISSVVITYNSSDANKNFTVKVGSSANPTSGTSITPTTLDNVYTFNCSSANANYFVMTNGTGAGYVDKIEINYGSSSSSTTYYTSTTTCASTSCEPLATPAVSATPGDGKITLSWAAVADADDYTVTVSKGVGYTTECGSAAVIGSITGTDTKQCIITGLTNGLTYTTTVVANAASSTCDSEAGTDTAMPMDCNTWTDPTLTWDKYSLNTSNNKTATLTITGTQHGTLSFKSNNPDVLSVAPNGTVTALNPGSATVTAHWTAADGYCEKSVISSTFAITGQLTITYNANYGETPATTTQTVTYNTAATLTANTFSRTGYTFMGWATTPNGEKVYNNSQANVTFTNSQTLYAVWQVISHNVTFTPSPTGATVTINNQSTSPQSVAYGTTVTIVITPAAHNTLSSVTATGATSGALALNGSGYTRTFTMPDEAVTVAVVMEAETQHTATFYNGGDTYGTVEAYLDDDFTAPEGTPVSCDEETFTFVGWVATPQTTEATSHPELVTFPQSMPEDGATFYALFSRSEGGSGGGSASVSFKTVSSDGNTAYTSDSDIRTNVVESYTGVSSFEGNRLYPGQNGAKLGANGGPGYVKLNLSSPITTNQITVAASQYGSDTGDLQVEVNGSNSFGSALSPSDGTLTFTNSSEVTISDLTVSTTSKRAYVASITLGGSGTSYYTTAPECIPCDYKVTLTKGAESHGTFTLSRANGTYDNCKTHLVVIVSGITPAEGYYCTGVTATGGAHVKITGPDDDGNYTVTYTKENTIESIVTANFAEIPSHTVTWSVDGNTSNQVTYKEGASITFPATATACEGKVFMGWSDVEVAEQATAPTYTTEAVMGASNLTFYAVFATATTSGGSGSSVVDELTRATTSVSSGSTTYSNWSGKTVTSDAVYAGNSAGSNDAIQLRSNNSNSGIITTTSGGKAKKVTVVWNSSTASDRKIDIYGKNSAYSAASDLYDNSKQGTKIGSITYGTSTELTISGDYEYIGIRSNSGALYLTSVSITWNTGSGGSSETTYSEFTTSCAACVTKVNLTKGTESHGTFSLDKANGEYNNCSSTSDFVVTVSNIVPANGYRLGSVTATSGAVSGPDGNGNYTVTFARGNSFTSTITANFEEIPSHTVTWSANGETSTETYREGTSIAFPASAEGCDGRVFRGWSTVEVPETDVEPDYVTSATMGTSDVTYYAVFATQSGSGSAYKLVESLTNGKEYIFVNRNSAGSGYAFNSSLSATSVTIEQSGSDMIVSTTATDAIVWTAASGWKLTTKDENLTYRVLKINGSGIALDASGNNLSWTTNYGLNGQSGSGTTKYYVQYDDGYTTKTSGSTSNRVWAYEKSGAVAAYTGYTTSCAECLTKVTLTKGEESHGSFTLSKGNGSYNNCVANFVVTVSSITPATDYYCTGVTATGGNSTVTSNGDGTYTVTYTKGNSITSIITANFAPVPTYTVTWSMNGDESNKTEYKEGQSILFPSSATVDCDDKVFRGWSSEPIAEQDEEPAYVTSATMATTPLTFYAVYATASSGGGSAGWNKVESLDDITNGTYVIENDGYALPNTHNTSSGPEKNNSYKLTVTDNAITSVVSDAMKWSFTMSDGHVATIKNAAGDYLYATNNNNGIRVGGTSDTWTFELNTSAPDFAMYDDNNSRYCATYSSGNDWRSYTSATADNYANSGKIHLYKLGGSGTSYSGYTTSCGASINAKGGKWLTASKGQKVKTVINVSAKNFEQDATLSASSNNSRFIVSLAETEVSATTGLSTTMTVEYRPTAANTTENATITLKAGDVIRTITVNGRSLPEQFLLVTKKSSTWYALPANMTGGASQYDGVEVTPNDATTPTSVAVAPSTVVYSLKTVANARYAEAGNCVRLVGNNNLCLWSNTEDEATGIQNSGKLSETNAEHHEWLLTTTDGASYKIANPNHPNFAAGRRLAYGSEFGLFKEETEFYIVSTGCNTKPQDVRTSARRADVTFSWISSAAQMHIDVYTDEGMTSTPISATATAAPYYMDGLAQETQYWYRLTPDEDTECAVTGTFTTYGPTIEVVEWKENSVVVLVDKPEDMHPKIVLAGEEEHGVGSGATATELFFSKYFEAEGTAKMLAIFNGTNAAISLSDVKILHRNTPNNTPMSLNSYGTTPGYIQSGEEIILYNTDSRAAVMECAENDPTFPSWYNANNNQNLNFGGKGTVRLFRGDKCIDIIGAMSEDAAASSIHSTTTLPKEGSVTPSWGDANGFTVATGDNYATKNVVETNYGLSTNRCLLIRKASVTSGDSAVLNNFGDFKTLGVYTGKDGQEHKGEWAGLQIPNASGGEADYIHTCEGFQEVGHFDYSKYYKDWNTISTGDENLSSYVVGGVETGTENTYEIPVTDLAKYSCLNLKFLLLENNVEVSNTTAQVPIIIKGAHSTNDAVFNAFVKDDDGNPLYDESINRCTTCEVLVMSGATLTKAADGALRDAAQVGNITVYPGGKLVVPAGTNYTTKTLTYRVEGDEGIPSSDLQGNLITSDKKLIVTRRIRNDRYYFFSLPYDCNLSDVRWTKADGAPAQYNVDYRLLEYDGEARAAEGSYRYWPGHWKMMEGNVIKAGKGYNIAVSSVKPRELVFPMTLSTDTLTHEERDKLTNTVDLEEYVAQYTLKDDNWNLVAHPYLTKLDFTGENAASIGDITWETLTDLTRFDKPDPDDPTQPTVYLLEGQLDGGVQWKLTEKGEFLIEGSSTAANCSIPDYSSQDATPWAQHRQLITSIKINANISEIGKYAFAQCTNLNSIYIGSQTYVNATTTSFYGVTLNNITLTVPQSLLSRYKTSTNVWAKMQITTYDENTASGAPRRTLGAGGELYVTMPKLDAEGNVDYDSWAISSLEDIPPFIAVFIQGRGKGSLTFNQPVLAAPAPARKLRAKAYDEDESVFVGVTIHGNGSSDEAALRLRQDFWDGYKPGFDLVKFMQFYTPRPRIYMRSGDDRLAFRAITDQMAENWQPVGVYCYEAGTYTFALSKRYQLNEIEAVWLRDNNTGEETNLLLGNYTITTTGQLYTNTRFSVKVKLRRKETDTPTYIEPVDDPNAPHKFIRDGLMYIMRDGKTYDLTGTPVVMDNLLLNQ